MESARQALVQASAELAGQVIAFESRMTAITENAKVQAVSHIARRTDDVTRTALDAQMRAMEEAGRTLFRTEVGPALQRVVMPLQGLVDRVERPWERWLTHAATAVAASFATWLLAVYLGLR